MTFKRENKNREKYDYQKRKRRKKKENKREKNYYQKKLMFIKQFLLCLAPGVIISQVDNGELDCFSLSPSGIYI